jgi:hypothetical protein
MDVKPEVGLGQPGRQVVFGVNQASFGLKKKQPHFIHQGLEPPAILGDMRRPDERGCGNSCIFQPVVWTAAGSGHDRDFSLDARFFKHGVDMGKKSQQ